MSGLVIAAPMRLEALLVASAARQAEVHRTGIGPRRSGAAAPALASRAASMLVVMGFCGAVGEGSQPGDVIVADELLVPDELRVAGQVRTGPPRSSAETIACSGAPALLAALCGRGLTVRHGPIASVPRPVLGGKRTQLHAMGAIAVDMESAWLAPGVEACPFGVVRVVVDTPDRELWRPLATVTGGARAAMSLRRAAAVLNEWGSEH